MQGDHGPDEGNAGGRECGWRLRALVLLLAALGLAGPARAQTTPSASSAPPPKWGPHIDLEGKAGTKRDIGEADVFLPLWQNADTLVFGNVRTRLDDDSGREGNFGLGLRHMLESGWNIGGYGYFDRRKTEHDNYFNQVTLGVEALSLDWDARANVYVPEGRRSHDVDSLSTAEISGTSVIFRGGEERSLRGFDAELGWRVPIWDDEAAQQLRVYGGAYRFYADGVDPVQGPRVRAELVFDEVPELWEGSRFTLGAEAQHDGPRGSQAFAVARLRIPLQLFDELDASLTPMERRMADPTVRDVDVVSQAGQFVAETATTTSGGSAITVLDGASTANLATSVSNAGANSTVILSGSFSAASQIFIAAGQTVMGAGTLTVRSPSGRTATLTTSSATVTSTVATSVSMAADNSTLTGVTLSKTLAGASSGVSVTGDNVTITNNTITMSSTTNNATGIGFSGGATGTVSGNTITATANGTATGLSVSGTSTVTVTGNTFSASGATTNNYAFLQTANINSGSTGNTLAASNTGGCDTNNAGSGFIGFTNAANCTGN